MRPIVIVMLTPGLDPDSAYDRDQDALYNSEHAPVALPVENNEHVRQLLDRLDARVEPRENGGETIHARMPIDSYKKSSGSSPE